MCGILAAIDFRKSFSALDKNQLNDSLKLIEYRGPDASDHKYYLGNPESIEEQYEIFLGQNRLSIIDLSDDGTQPFSLEDNYHIIYNGEVYNYIELRAELIAKGYSFKTATDTEVVLNLYREYGLEGFNKMNGMWAIVIFDRQKNKVVVSRDRFAIKPLYKLKKGNQIFFASEIKQLLPFLEERKVNYKVLGNYLNDYLFDYSNETFFEGIEKIPSKTSVEYDLLNGEERSFQYWNFDLNNQKPKKEKELIEEFKILFSDAIKIRLRSDVKVGNTLSGGLDSSSIAVVSDNVSDKSLTNLSVVTKNKEYSEERYVDLLIKHNGIKVHKIENDKSNPWADAAKVIWHNDEPILSLSTVAHFNMMKTFKKETDITVILSGQGGDEALGGYNKYLFYNINELLATKKLSGFIRESAYLTPKLLGEIKLKHAKRYLGSKFKPKSIIDEVITLKYKNEFINTASTFVERQILDINKFSVPALTHYEDRSSMHQSLEIRLPFLDYRLVNFNINLPLNLKIRNGFSKYILRKAIDQLPKEVAWRNDKKGFDVDEQGFMTNENMKYFIDLFEDSEMEKRGILNTSLFLNKLNEYLEGKSRYWIRDINRIIFTEIWMQTYFR